LENIDDITTQIKKMSELENNSNETVAPAAASEPEYVYDSGKLEEEDNMTDEERIQYLRDRGKKKTMFFREKEKRNTF
jgi:hypothetical protein